MHGRLIFITAKATAAAGLCVLGALALPARAQPGMPPDYGLDFVTIGAPGNRPTIPSEVPSLPYLRVGSVGSEYRLMRTEVTVGQFFEFAEQYVRWHPEAVWGNELTGRYIPIGGPGRIYLPPWAVDKPHAMSWRMAARFANWLHNGKVDEPWAFESGAYDTSTFTTNAKGWGLHQLKHSPGAKYWIPSQDEWIKAAFYDPNRYGPGAGGYWRYPHRSNEVPVSGVPWNGGQTNAGLWMPPEYEPMDVKSYPAVLSPWDLMDLSGGESEWTETARADPGNRTVLGSDYGHSIYFLIDRPDGLFIGLPVGSITGLRLASAVPAPSAFALALCAVIPIHRRRSSCI